MPSWFWIRCCDIIPRHPIPRRLLSDGQDSKLPRVRGDKIPSKTLFQVGLYSVVPSVQGDIVPRRHDRWKHSKEPYFSDEYSLLCTDITGIFLPPICRNMEAIFILYYIIFILLGDLCEVKFSGRIIVVKLVVRKYYWYVSWSFYDQYGKFMSIYSIDTLIMIHSNNILFKTLEVRGATRPSF